MNLAETQAAIFAFAFERKRPAELPRLGGRAALDPERRYRFYRDAVLWSTVETLRLRFPQTAAFFTGREFAACVERYMARPLDGGEPTTRLVGEFPAFLRGPGGAAALGDLAELELAHRLVAEEAASPVSAAALTAAGCGPFAEARLALVAAHRLLRLTHDALPTWAGATGGGSAPLPVARPTQVLVWRQGLHVYHAELEPAQAVALERLRQGRTLEDVCASFEGVAAPGVAAHAALASWFAHGLVASVRWERP
jgi:hypothetical protein